jgi:hypothetical protein
MEGPSPSPVTSFSRSCLDDRRAWLGCGGVMFLLHGFTSWGRTRPAHRTAFNWLLGNQGRPNDMKSAGVCLFLCGPVSFAKSQEEIVTLAKSL